MSTNNGDRGGDRRVDGATGGSFAGHGVPDDRMLLAGAAKALAAPRDTRVRVDDLTLAAVTAAFREAYAGLAGEEAPADVEAALDDAVAWTREEHGDEERDLRGELLPAFFDRLAEFHDAYHGAEEPVVTA